MKPKNMKLIYPLQFPLTKDKVIKQTDRVQFQFYTVRGKEMGAIYCFRRTPLNGSEYVVWSKYKIQNTKYKRKCNERKLIGTRKSSP